MILAGYGDAAATAYMGPWPALLVGWQSCRRRSAYFSGGSSRKYRWTVMPAVPQVARALESELGIGRLLPTAWRSVVSRIRARSDLPEPRLKSLSDPMIFLKWIPGREPPVCGAGIRESLVIFGITMWTGDGHHPVEDESDFLGWTVDHYLPHRWREGMGQPDRGELFGPVSSDVPAGGGIVVPNGPVEQIGWFATRGWTF